MSAEKPTQYPTGVAEPTSDQRTFIHGIGTAVPRRAITQEEVIALVRQIVPDPRTDRVIRRIAQQSSIGKRHFAVLEGRDGAGRVPFYMPASEAPGGPGMGARNALFDDAARDLVCRAAGALPRGVFEELQTLVTVSCTHASSPGLERPLFEHAGLSPGVHRWNLGFMGCSAGLAALRLVSGLSPALRNALVCTCELSSLHFQYSNAIDQITANMLFADGAAVVALSPQPSEVAVLNCRSVHLPEAADQMVWFADDHGLRLELSRALPDTLGAHIREAVEKVLAGSGRARDQIAHWLVHPGGPKILDAVESALDLGPDALSDSRGVLYDFGNMSSSTVFFVLQRLLEQQKEGLCVALSFGPGLTIELVLLEVTRRRGRAD